MNIKRLLTLLLLVSSLGSLQAQEWEIGVKSLQTFVLDNQPQYIGTNAAIHVDYIYLFVPEQRLGMGIEAGRNGISYHTMARLNYMYEFFLSSNFYIGVGAEGYMGVGFKGSQPAIFMGGMGILGEVGWELTKSFTLAIGTGIRWTQSNDGHRNGYRYQSAWNVPLNINLRFTPQRKSKKAGN